MVIGRRAQGFTLVELIAALAVLVILASMSAPSFQRLIANARLQAMASDLQAAMMLARSEAVKRNAQVTLTPSQGSWLDGWQVNDANNQVLAQFSAREGVDINSNTNLVTFQGNGRLNRADVPPEIEVLDPKESGDPRCIRTDRSGRPYVTRQQC